MPRVRVIVDHTVAVDGPRLDFESFFLDHYRGVLGLAVVLSGRRAVAEEITQEAFVSAYLRWDRIGRYDDPGAWVRRVVANLATSTLRRRGRELRALARLSRRRQVVDEIEVEVDRAFWEAVRELPRRQAQCVSLRYLEDQSTAEIAVILGIAEPTVRVHLHHARAALADRFDSDAGMERP